jgi:DNA-binding transcriptional LysR family regulator
MQTFDRQMLADLNVFLTIVRRGSMAKAAIELGVSTSALSHRLRKLETDLGVRLLNRTSRSLKPTDAGATLAGELETGFRVIGDALTGLENHRQFPIGTLRLNMLRDAAPLVLNPVLPLYAEAFPQMRLDVTTDDRMVDIIAEGFDAGIRYGDRVPLDMVGVALTRPLRWVVVASPALIERVGVPDSPQDLLRRPCIEMRIGDNSLFSWELGNGDDMVRLDVRGPLATNGTEQAVDAALRGIGFAYCLERRAEREVAAGRLRIVLPQWASEGPPLTIYYPSRRQPPPGLRQLIDTIRSAEGLKPIMGTDGEG